AHTGAVLPEAVKEAGAVGTVLNHAEHKISDELLQASLRRAREAGLRVMVCAESLERTKSVAGLGPDFVAVEPPELIGGKISVSSAKPELIAAAVQSVGRVPLVVGAGIHSQADVRKSFELGAIGVFVASAVVSAPDPRKVVQGLLEGFPQ
ncbi:MAG: triose-phosphate isomerase, partial [Candidatus Diapherotrites archaeon]|nr:triose-phosphate isomerase [Candidatus Diapherotrites archaeon]